MSGLIKGGEASGAIAAIDWSGGDQDIATGPTIDPMVEELQRQIDDLEGALVAADLQREAEVAAARLAGRDEAIAAFNRDEAKALEALRVGVDAAATTWAIQCDKLETLAPLLAMASLHKVFAGADDFQSLVERAVKRRLDTLRLDSVISVSVSTADFPSEHHLDRLASPGLDLRCDPALAAGECRFELRLGEITLSLKDHWGALQALMSALAADDPAP